MYLPFSFKAGFYVYVETSQPAKPGQKTRIISPDVQPSPTGHKCVTFWYYMYGRSVATLNMYVQTGAALPTTATWKRTGAQGRQWKSATVDVASKVVFNVSDDVVLLTVTFLLKY